MSARSGAGPAAWCGWGGLVLFSFLGGLGGGVGGLLTGAGVYLVLVALVALLRGRVRWARLRGRGAAGVALAGALVLTGIGGATGAPTDLDETTTSATPSTSAPEPSTTRRTTPAPTEAATPTPTTTPAATPTKTRTPTPSRKTSKPSTEPTPTLRPTPAPAPGTALAALATLPVKGRAPTTGYDRDRFGQAWADVDRNGCDTRNDVLRRDLHPFVLKAGTHGCLVLSGTLAEPYTGRTIHFVRGVSTSTEVQVDHVVALSDAWQKGAQQLDTATRTAFANDPLNLLAVDGPTNAAKGDGDAATWLPPRKSFRCDYVARQVAVKVRYHLWVTAAERDAVARVLATCPGRTLPTGRAIPLGGGPERSVTPAPQPTPRTSTAPKPAGGGLDPRFATCGDALDAGYGHYVRGQDPEYDWYRDGDGDGIVCED